MSKLKRSFLSFFHSVFLCTGKRKNNGRKDTGESEGVTSLKDRITAYGDTDVFTKGMERNDLALPRAVLKDDSDVREFMAR